MEGARQDLRSSPALGPHFHRATPTRGEKLCTDPLKLSSSPALQRQTRVDLTISLAHQQLTPQLRHHLLRRASIGLDPLSSADKRYLRHLQLFIGKDLSRITTDDVLIFAQAKRDGIAGSINAATQQRLLRSIQKAQLPLVDQDTLLAKHRALRREVARIVPKQATPISPQDLLQFLRNCPSNMREAVALTWRGAARVADVSNLIAQDLTGSPQNLNIAFSYKTKASTANPWRLGMYPVLHVDRQTLSDQLLKRLLARAHALSASHGGTTPLFSDFTAKQVTSVLRQEFPRAHYSSYSLRRGATKLLTAAACSTHSNPQLISLLLKHRGGDLVADTTVRYNDIQGRHELFEATGASDLANALDM